MTRVVSALTLRPPRKPVFVGGAAGVGVVCRGCTVVRSHTPTVACSCPTVACPRWSALYPRTPAPTSASRVGRPCFQSHAMVRLLLPAMRHAAATLAHAWQSPCRGLGLPRRDGWSYAGVAAAASVTPTPGEEYAPRAALALAGA